MMTQLSLARRLSMVLVFGHIALFFFGLLVAAFGRLELTDSVQMILMGSPLLAVVALSGFVHMMTTMTIQSDDPPVDSSVARFLLFVVSAFIIALFIVYSMGLFRTERVLSADGIKILVGTVETVLGGYIASIKDRLFVVAT
jgi:hypothetical protein